MLKYAACERGLMFTDDVSRWLLTHYRRNMPSLMRMLEKLDRFALEHQRAITPLLPRAMPADSFQ
ncbi:HdaA/DnaA family protein [Candidatus Vallotia tarda]|uniref:HdaA/DnaA family protein n=1 Tax=Candidatus Vallotiella hemipterorum TaxID=1177213 RepID=UPI001FE6EC80|nr:hypothetical protein [Candidatus Vallotia tarda]